MPPANSPAERIDPNSIFTGEQQTSSPISYLTELQSMTSPVLDLASTLTIYNHAEDDVDAENVAFLRNTFDASDNFSSTFPQTLRGERRARETQSRMRSPSEELRERHFHESRLQQLRQRQDSLQAWSDRSIHRMRSAYGEGAPSHQSLFDWAPAGDDNGDEMEAIFAELTRQQPNTHPEILRVLARARIDSNRDIQNRPTSYSQLPGQSILTHEPPASLRSAAILQSFRRNHRILTRSREHLNRLNAPDRETTSANERPSTLGADRRDESDPNGRHRGQTSDSTYTGAGGNSRYELNRMAWQASQPTTEARTALGVNVEGLRRRYLENPSSSNKTSEFERIIKYLHVLRSPDSDLHRPVDYFEHFETPDKRHSWDNADRLKKHATCPPPPTSWLISGTSFVGTQQATPIASSGATMYRLVQSQPRNSTLDPALNRAANWEASVPLGLRHLSTSELISLHSPPSSTTTNMPTQDPWTVKVDIHNVDYKNMTLQGTMEAFNVPSLISSTPSSSSNTNSASKTTFSTYLEGELIDFTTHTLLTEPDTFGVKTTPDIDAAYWRRLEPFTKLTDDEIARNLLDRSWIEEQLMGQYVLMRWKERCFVKPALSSSITSSPSLQSYQPPVTSASPATNSIRQQSLSNPTQPSLNHNSTTSFLSGANGHRYGLSISGFYYVSLRRSDGRLEGLYFDPKSSPYQHLEMKPRAGGWGSAAWEFR